MHMTRLFLRLSLAAAALVSVSSIAMSADLLPPPPPPEELRPATYDWTGVYIGAVGGLGFVDSAITRCVACDPELAGDYGFFGAVAGLNYQFDSFVIGVEGDWTWGGKAAENTLDVTQIDIDQMATIRGRIGWANDNTLIYATAGYATADVTLHDAIAGPPLTRIEESSWQDGWVVGGGIEHAFWDGLHGRIEYLYADLGEKSYDFGGGNVDDLDLEIHMVRAALTYNFSW
jgi:outer membrane immunogenic protein